MGRLVVTSATLALVALMFTAALVVRATVYVAPGTGAPTRSPITDCRLGPHDCGYSDNGHNGDQ